MAGWTQEAQNRIAMLLIAAIVDMVLGDPQRLWHPVQGIGALISFLERALRHFFRVPILKDAHPAAGHAAPPDIDAYRKKRERAAGLLLALLVPLTSAFLARCLFFACDLAYGQIQALARGSALARHAGVYANPAPVKAMATGAMAGSASLPTLLASRPWPRILAEGILCGRLLAMRSLGDAGLSVQRPLEKGDIEGARQAVSMIVGRDTDRLDASGIAKAAVETVAENTSDGVTAPLFYMILFGGLGGIFYKAVNTMDSMVGYKNDRYRYFGTAAARLDDAVNYLPSRLTALLMILACCLPGHETLALSPMPLPEEKPLSARIEKKQGKTSPDLATIPDAGAALQVWRRDRRKSPSPNSAQTESVCAGALHLRLLGDAWYFGQLHHKAEIGDGGRQIQAQDIARATRLMQRTTALLFICGILLLATQALG